VSPWQAHPDSLRLSDPPPISAAPVSGGYRVQRVTGRLMRREHRGETGRYLAGRGDIFQHHSSTDRAVITAAQSCVVSIVLDPLRANTRRFLRRPLFSATLPNI